MRRSIIAVATAIAASVCGVPAEAPPSTTSPTTEHYYTTAPTNAPVDDTAVCTDQFDLLVYSALAYVCPQLADYQGLPVMKDCADLTPDPSADPEARVFCRGER